MYSKLLSLGWIHSQASGDGPGVTIGRQSQEPERLAGIEWRRRRTKWDPPGTLASIAAPDHSDLLKV